MGVIGQAFSPAFLSLVTQKAENSKSRNLQAAIADRELRLKRDAQAAGVAQQNISNAFEFQRARAGQSAGRAQIELLKEEGRRIRAKDANVLKESLANSELKRREEDDASKATVRAARAAQIGGREGRAEALQPGAQVLQGQDIAKGERDIGLDDARLKKLVTDIATSEAKLDEFEGSREQRAALVEAQIDRYSQLIRSGEANDILKAESAAFSEAMKLSNLRLGREKAFIALNKILSSFDIYNQSIDDRAKEGGVTAAAVKALHRLQQEWFREFGQMSGAHPDFQSRIKQLLPPSIQQGQQPQAPAGADGGPNAAMPGVDDRAGAVFPK